jgi:PleD family two-component response regulator
MSVWIVGVVAIIALAAGARYYHTREQELRGQLRSVQSQLDERGNLLEDATQTLHRLAGIDALTKLANHSHFQEFLRNEWRRALREATGDPVP